MSPCPAPAVPPPLGSRDRGDRDRASAATFLDGARRVFFDKGFDGASMDEIARAGGVSKATIYVYFDSKEDLFEALGAGRPPPRPRN